MPISVPSGEITSHEIASDIAVLIQRSDFYAEADGIDTKSFFRNRELSISLFHWQAGRHALSFPAWEDDE
jgi:hypothetical protein